MAATTPEPSIDSLEVDNDVLIPTSTGHMGIGDFAEVRNTETLEHELEAVPV